MSHYELDDASELMSGVVEAFGIELDFVLSAIMFGEERYEIEYFLFVARWVGVDIAIVFVVENIA